MALDINFIERVLHPLLCVQCLPVARRGPPPVDEAQDGLGTEAVANVLPESPKGNSLGQQMPEPKQDNPEAIGEGERFVVRCLRQLFAADSSHAQVGLGFETVALRALESVLLLGASLPVLPPETLLWLLLGVTDGRWRSLASFRESSADVDMRLLQHLGLASRLKDSLGQWQRLTLVESLLPLAFDHRTEVSARWMPAVQSFCRAVLADLESGERLPLRIPGGSDDSAGRLLQEFQARSTWARMILALAMQQVRFGLSQHCPCQECSFHFHTLTLPRSPPPRPTITRSGTTFWLSGISSDLLC